MVICLDQGADLHMAQLMSLPLTVSCFSKIQIGFTFLIPAHSGSPRKTAVERALQLYATKRLNKKKPCTSASYTQGNSDVISIHIYAGWFSPPSLVTLFEFIGAI